MQHLTASYQLQMFVTLKVKEVYLFQAFLNTIIHHHHMALQPNSGPGLPLWGFVTITFLQGWIVSPAPNPQPGGAGLVFMTPGDRVAQLYPQALATHFSRLLRHA
jgi:hypothetical protein